jgi:purine catabolism regulator
MFSVDDFLKLSTIESHSVECGHDTLSKKKIKYISVIEMPIDDFIRPGEIVLSTALGCYDDKEKLFSFVTEIYNTGASALVVSVKVDEYHLPQNVIDFCNGVGFPVIIIPWESRFAEIIEEVIEKRNERDSKKIKAYEKVQNELLFSYLNGAEMDNAARLIAHSLKCDTIITNEFYEIKGNFTSKISREGINKEMMDTYPIKISVKSYNRNFGFLFLKNYNKTDFPGEEILSIEKYFVMPLTLWFNKEDVISITTMKLKDDFVWQMAKGSFENPESLKISATRLGFDLNTDYSCISGKFDLLNFSEDDSTHVENIILSTAKGIGKKIISTIRLNNMIIFIENDKTETVTTISSFIDVMEEKFSVDYPDAKLFWGISQTNSLSNDFNKLYEDAKFVLDMCENQRRSLNRIFFDEAGIYRILTALSDKKDVMDFAKKIIKPLADYDLVKNISLIYTIMVYIKNNYNISKTARDLHMHRQTLLYRLSKIEELMDISLENHNEIFLLETCIRLTDGDI